MNGDGSISLRKFRATLEKVAQKTGSTLDVPWELVQAIWGVPERVDYVTFCSWLNPTKLHRLKQKASKLAARAVKASGDDDAFGRLLADGRGKSSKPRSKGRSAKENKPPR